MLTTVLRWPRTWIVLWLCGLGLAWAAPGAAQTVALDLGSELMLVTAGAQVRLPVTMTTSGAGPVEVTMEIGYPTQFLRFVDAKIESSALAADAEITAEKKGEPANGEQVVAIVVKAAKPMTTGSLLTLGFGLTDAVRSGAEMHIANLRRLAKSADGKELPTRGAEGVISTAEPPAPCFFYMH